MSVDVTARLTFTVAETVDTGTPASTDANSVITHDQFNVVEDLTSATGVPVTKFAAFSIALSGGAISVDLTALPGTNAGVVDMTGLKVQWVMFQNPVSNANSITIADGASNGYGGWGASLLIVLQPGQSVMLQGTDLEPDVSASVKIWDLTGTASQPLNVEVAAG